MPDTSILAATKPAHEIAVTFDLAAWWSELTAWDQTAMAVVGAFLVHLIVRLVILRGLDRIAASTENDLDDRLVYFIRRFYLLILVFVLFLFVLRIHGVQITPFLASAGIVGIAIGLAAKETLSDILSGIFLITDQPARIGDRVKIESPGRHWGGWGDVVDVGLRRTQIRNTDGIIVNYPNNVLANSVITNFSYEDAPVRVRVRFQINYSCDLDKASEVACRAIQNTERVLPDTAEIVVRSLWDDSGGHMGSGILLEGRYRIENVRNRTKIRSEVLKNISKALKAAAIPLASPRVRIEQV